MLGARHAAQQMLPHAFIALTCRTMQGKIKSLESVFLFALPVKEYQVGR